MPERRRYSRLVVSLPAVYQVPGPEGDEPDCGRGLLRDISLSGAYFYLQNRPGFIPGQTLALTIAALLPGLNEIPEIHSLEAIGLVTRLEPPGPSQSRWGVALSFVDSLRFAAAP